MIARRRRRSATWLRGPAELRGPFDASAHITLARDEGSGGIVATVSPPLPGFPAAGIEDEATDSILLLGLRGTHFGDGKGILWSNNVLWTRVGAPSCGPGCVLT